MFKATEGNLGKTVKLSSYKSSLCKDHWGAVGLRDVLQSEAVISDTLGRSVCYLSETWPLLAPPVYSGWYGKVNRHFTHTVTLTWIIWHVHFVLLEHCLEGFDLIAIFAGVCILYHLQCAYADAGWRKAMTELPSVSLWVGVGVGEPGVFIRGLWISPHLGWKYSWPRIFPVEF